ncbi:AAA family ATPase [Almyronema epifaneia]|uniref:AAA family ATPase n=1 Tax=Almyronema epifaneia S1 TaxID=2991925 RepID=A0ABW6IL99_9CYAN
MLFDPAYCRTEGDVESKLIVQYLLPALGYSQKDWYQEIALGSIRLDFLAFAAQVIPFDLSDGSPLSLVIEAKSPQRKLDPYARRLRQYLTSLHANHGILTNGKEFRIYERFGESLRILFKCSGTEICDRIEEIKYYIGKESLKDRNARISPIEPANNNRRRNVKVISVYHNKGGVGKTTISVNLAAALRKKGYSVLLIDLDSQANSTFATGLVKFQFEEDDNLKDNNVYHLLESGDFNFIPDVARQSNVFNTPEIDVVPSHISLIQGQYTLNQIKASQTRLIKKLKQEEKNYDFVIVDTPPSRDIYAQVALIAAHHLIIPSDLKPFANQGLSSVQSFIKEIDEFRESLNRKPLNILGVLPSKISTNSKSFQNTFPRQKETVVRHYELPVMDSIIFERTALSHCINKTLTVGDLEIPDPKSIFDFSRQEVSANQSAEEFENLAEEVLEKTEKA